MHTWRRRGVAALLAASLALTGVACEGEDEGGVEQEDGEQEDD
jgi:hypothetical protein